MEKRNEKQHDKKPLQMFSAKLQRAEQRAADFLNGKTANWPAGRLKLALVLFCFAMGGASIYIMGNALRNDHGPPAVPTNKIHIPAIIQKSQGHKQDSITIKQSNNEHQY